MSEDTSLTPTQVQCLQILANTSKPMFAGKLESSYRKLVDRGLATSDLRLYSVNHRTGISEFRPAYFITEKGREYVLGLRRVPAKSQSQDGQ